MRATRRRCGRTGCRAWAMRGAGYCWAHRGDTGPDGIDSDAEPPDADERARGRRVEAFAALVRESEQGDLLERVVRVVVGAAGAGDDERMTPDSLEGEIRALRLVLSRVIAVDALDGEARELAATVARLVDTIVRAVRAQHGLSAGDEGGVHAATLEALAEMDLGEPR